MDFSLSKPSIAPLTICMYFISWKQALLRLPVSDKSEVQYGVQNLHSLGRFPGYLAFGHSWTKALGVSKKF